MRMLTFPLVLPVQRCRIVQEITPMAIPSDMLYIKGMERMHRNAGMASSMFSQSIFATDAII